MSAAADSRKRPDAIPLLRRPDPRFRLIAALVASIAPALLTRPETAAAACVSALAAAFAARLSVGQVLRRLAVLNMFTVFVWLTVPLSLPGDPLWIWGPLSFSRPGAELALSVTLKCNAVLLLFLSLTAGMEPSVMGQALERLHCPSSLVFLLFFTSRYVYTVAEEYARLAEAARLRGFAPGVNLHTYRTVGCLLGMVLVRSHDRALRVYEAMRLRGFDGRFRSTARFSASAGDVLFLVAASAVPVALVLFDRFPELFRA